jgi:hypothetical protein
MERQKFGTLADSALTSIMFLRQRGKCLPNSNNLTAATRQQHWRAHRLLALIPTSQDAGWGMHIMLSCSRVAGNLLVFGFMGKELSTPFSRS